jgi:predicted RND superfamily exporter protein
MASEPMTGRTLAAVVLLGLTAVSLVGLGSLRVDNRLERWMGSDPVHADEYESFRSEFGTDEFVVAAISGRPLFDPEALEIMLGCVDALESNPAVVGVDGLPVVYRDVFGAEDPDELEIEFTSTPFYRGLFLSDDSETAGLVIQVAPHEEPGSRTEIVGSIRQALSPLEEAGFMVRLVGSPVLAAALDEVSRQESLRTFPIALIFTMVILGWLLRSVRCVVVAATSAAMSVVLTLGVMVVSGRSLSMVTSVLPSLLFVLALSNCIHILLSYQRHRRTMDLREALRCALSETTRPCSLAAATTALGFASLVAASVPPVREVGLFAALGILVSLAVNLSVVPTLIRWMRIPERTAVVQQRWVGNLHTRSRAVLIVAGGLTVAAVALIPKVPVVSNPLSFLPENHPITRDYRDVGDRLTGSYTMEVVVRTPEVWWTPAVLKSLEALEREMALSDGVSTVVSPLDLLRKARHWQFGFDPQAYELPSSKTEAEELLAGPVRVGTDHMSRFATDDGMTVRLSAVVKEMDQGRFLAIVDRSRSAVQALGSDFDGWVTGMVLRLVQAQRDLVSSQIRSLGLAFLVVFGAIAAGLGSWRLTAFALFPNVVPVVVVFAMMALFQIPLDAATVMVASVALGIAVDNTVHLLVAVQRERQDADSPGRAVAAALGKVGVPLVVTTAAACIGFLSLSLSRFVPIRDFGLLAASAMVAALAADLFVVPAMLTARESLRDASKPVALLVAAGIASAAMAADISLGERVEQAARGYDLESATVALAMVRDARESDVAEDLAELHGVAALSVAELLRIEFEQMLVDNGAERRETGQKIDAVAREGLAVVAGLPESSERQRVRADLIATMIRSDFRAKKFENEFRTAVERALELDETNPRAWVSAAKPPLFAPPERGRDLAEALRHLNRALEIDPALESALLLRAMANSEAGDDAAARADWRAALEQNPRCRPAADALAAS